MQSRLTKVDHVKNIWSSYVAALIYYLMFGIGMWLLYLTDFYILKGKFGITGDFYATVNIWMNSYLSYLAVDPHEMTNADHYFFGLVLLPPLITPVIYLIHYIYLYSIRYCSACQTAWVRFNTGQVVNNFTNNRTVQNHSLEQRMANQQTYVRDVYKDLTYQDQEWDEVFGCCNCNQTDTVHKKSSQLVDTRVTQVSDWYVK